MTTRSALDDWLASSAKVLCGGDPDMPDAMTCAPSDGSRTARVALKAGDAVVLGLNVDWAEMVGWAVEGDGIPDGCRVAPAVASWAALDLPHAFRLVGETLDEVAATESLAGSTVRLSEAP